jgi:hypothetical protein
MPHICEGVSLSGIRRFIPTGNFLSVSWVDDFTSLISKSEKNQKLRKVTKIPIADKNELTITITNVKTPPGSAIRLLKHGLMGQLSIHLRDTLNIQ